MSFSSISAVGITLLILGAALVMSFNAQQMSNYVTNQVEVAVFLKTNVTDKQGQDVAKQVQQLPGVKSVQYISKEEGLKSLSTRMGQYKDILNGLKSNPLPVQLVVKAANPKETAGVANEISSLPNVDKVRDAKGILGRMFRFLDTVRNIGLVFVAALVVTAMFLISNTIKITIMNRRREIEIMKLVGATNWFVRWPFVVEALFIGAIGSAIPYAVIVYAYHSMFIRSGGTFIGLGFSLLPVSLVAGRLAWIMFGLGIVIGLYGGIMSIRKFLKV
ncbi:ABC transporter permease [Alicyclobacillus sp. SO9]|nr:ABC transporter permease [Alicyclobacillus sp. SO9]